jgi:sugar lactone lactonase YvrE
MSSRMLAGLISLALSLQALAQINAAASRQAADLRALVDASPLLPFRGLPCAAQPPASGWESGMVSWVAVDGKGIIYEIQRGDKADPILVLNRDGKILRSWGKGEYTIPHGIRIDTAGNIWTTDAASSKVIEYSALGKKLTTISVGGQPENGGSFRGTTDIAFAPNGHLYITDGYGNARVMEYTADGKLVKQWGKPGTGPGEFNLPHAIQIDEHGVIYIADRENGRIEKFDLDGKFLGQIIGLGRVFSLKLAGNVLWATIQPFNQPLTSGGWAVKIDRETGQILGHLGVPERGGHSIDLMPTGEPLITVGSELLCFQVR